MEFDIDFNGVVSEEEVKVDYSFIRINVEFYVGNDFKDIDIIIKIEVEVNFYIDIFICKYVIYLVLNL